jgi:hypothetical protein
VCSFLGARWRPHGGLSVCGIRNRPRDERIPVGRTNQVATSREVEHFAKCGRMAVGAFQARVSSLLKRPNERPIMIQVFETLVVRGDMDAIRRHARRAQYLKVKLATICFASTDCTVTKARIYARVTPRYRGDHRFCVCRRAVQVLPHVSYVGPKWT